MDKIMQLYKLWQEEPTLPPNLKQDLDAISDNPSEIEDRFYRYSSFGTGGMRGLLGAGTNRINIYTIRQVAEGLALHIQAVGVEAMQKGLVIAYDTRHFSSDFALETAKTIAKYGIRVYLFKESRPTPELSFAIRQLQAYAGVVITASHNPAGYNGIKIYGEDGGQLPPAAADKIVGHMETVKDVFSIRTGSENDLITDGFLLYILEDIDAAYQRQLLSLSENKKLMEARGKDLSIIYTPLHGAGLVPITEGLRAFGFKNVSVVQQQCIQDPTFPTVAYPNPEERQAFDLASELGRIKDADLLLATDPDADRLGVAVKTGKGDYELLSGNQLGALLLQYILSEKNHKGELPQNGIIMKTIVTSELGRSIAAKFGILTMDTLTGFKFISEKIEEFHRTGEYTFLFGYEESYGYLIGDFVRDKDAVQAALMTAEMTAYHKLLGKSLIDVLNGLYDEFGYYRESLNSLTYEGKAGQELIGQIMETFRNSPPSSIGGVAVTAIEDYDNRTRQHADGRCEKLTLPQADVIKLVLEDGSWICIRPSGTEPKCKLYFGVKKDSLDEAEAALRLLEAGIMNVVNSVHS